MRHYTSSQLLDKQVPVPFCRALACACAVVAAACVQELEVSVREGSAAKGQLEEAKRKLQRTKTQLQAMTDRHVGTMSQLETAKVGAHKLLMGAAGIDVFAGLMT